MTLEEIGQLAIELRHATLEVERLGTAEGPSARDARCLCSAAEQLLTAAIEEYERQAPYGRADGQSEMD